MLTADSIWLRRTRIGKRVDTVGDGAGGFVPAVTPTVAVGDVPFGVAVGDFNGDGKLDLAVSNDNSDNVSILLGNGDATFSAAQSYPAGERSFRLSVGDLNGDGKLDLAVPNNSGSGSVALLFGDGSGAFRPADSFERGQPDKEVEIADLNGDGKPDLAATNRDSVSVFLGNGDGTFGSAQNHATGTRPSLLWQRILMATANLIWRRRTEPPTTSLYCSATARADSPQRKTLPRVRTLLQSCRVISTLTASSIW